MNDIAVMIADHLHFDVSCAADQLFEIDLAVAEGLLGLAPPQGHELQQARGVLDHPHAAAATAP